MSLSICLLTRDAQQKLERALGSTADLRAEIIVVDTGSTDSTVETARALGARVSSIAWEDDFGKAQNHALGQATGDWIFWLNPDEELLPGQRDRMVALMARTDAFAYAVRVQDVTQPDRPDRFTETFAPRLFRRQRDVHFVGRLHPSFVPPLEELARRENQVILGADLVVRHHAYLSVLTDDKLRWANRLLELELRDRPGQLHYLIEYGRNLLRLNDAQGHRILAEASALVLTCVGAATAPTANVASLLEYLLSVSAEQSQSAITPEQARELTLRWFPASPPLLWLLAKRSFDSGESPDAVRFLELLVQMGRTGAYDRSAAFDPSIMAESALANLGNCYIRLGDLDRAEWCFGQILASPTHRSKAREGYARVQALRRNH